MAKRVRGVGAIRPKRSKRLSWLWRARRTHLKSFSLVREQISLARCITRTSPVGRRPRCLVSQAAAAAATSTPPNCASTSASWGRSSYGTPCRRRRSDTAWCRCAWVGGSSGCSSGWNSWHRRDTCAATPPCGGSCAPRASCSGRILCRTPRTWTASPCCGCTWNIDIHTRWWFETRRALDDERLVMGLEGLGGLMIVGAGGAWKFLVWLFSGRMNFSAPVKVVCCWFRCVRGWWGWRFGNSRTDERGCLVCWRVLFYVNQDFKYFNNCLVTRVVSNFVARVNSH